MWVDSLSERIYTMTELRQQRCLLHSDRPQRRVAVFEFQDNYHAFESRMSRLLFLYFYFRVMTLTILSQNLVDTLGLFHISMIHFNSTYKSFGFEDGAKASLWGYCLLKMEKHTQEAIRCLFRPLGSHFYLVLPE